jgi:DNA-binding XRE family transcriptional regulator
MNEPKTYAQIEEGTVTNLISLCDANAADFPNAVCIDCLPVAIGDTYISEKFYHDGIEVVAI